MQLAIMSTYIIICMSFCMRTYVHRLYFILTLVCYYTAALGYERCVAVCWTGHWVGPSW